MSIPSTGSFRLPDPVAVCSGCGVFLTEADIIGFDPSTEERWCASCAVPEPDDPVAADRRDRVLRALAGYESRRGRGRCPRCHRQSTSARRGYSCPSCGHAWTPGEEE